MDRRPVIRYRRSGTRPADRGRHDGNRRGRQGALTKGNTAESAQERARQLREILQHANHAYHVLDNPDISDAEYDRLFRELQDIEASHPQLQTPDSPTQRVGAEPATALVKHRHRVSMLSLGNAFDESELEAWQSRIAKLQPDVLTAGYQLELKIDGAGASLTYESGVLTVGATRGNGAIGENVTANARTIPDVPLRLLGNDHPAVIEIRGEVYFPLDAFADLNSRREANGEEAFANPRNAAAGSLRQLDSKVTRDRGLRFFAFHVESDTSLKVTTQHETLDLLESWGFRVAPHRSTVDSLADAHKIIADIESELPTLNFKADGVVVKVDRLSLHESLGVVGGREPRWAIARKFAPEVAITRLEDIQINIGRTGALNPAAVLTPVEIGGVTVSNATLHNMDLIEAKDIRVGDMVEITRAGEVIPQVLGPVLNRRPRSARKYKPPTHCPACGTGVEQPEGEVALYCPNLTCPARQLEGMIHYASRGALDIRGLGGQRVTQLYEAGLLRTVADLYELTPEVLQKLEGFGEKAAHQLVDALAQSKTQPLARLLFALGIRHVGAEVARLLAQQFVTMAALVAATIEEIAAVEGIGPAIGEAVVQFLAEPKNKKLINRLGSHGVNLKETKTTGTGDMLAGQTFVITGTLPNLSRAAAKKRIEDAGGRVVSSISKNTSAIVVGSSPGSKLEQAQALGTKQLDEIELLRLIGNDT